MAHANGIGQLSSCAGSGAALLDLALRIEAAQTLCWNQGAPGQRRPHMLRGLSEQQLSR